MQIQFQVLPNAEVVDRECSRLGTIKGPGEKFAACAQPLAMPTATQNGICLVILQANVELETVGHEIAHCLIGQFHK
jgi:hypothetical protein